MRIIIGLCGLIGSGKSTVALHLCMRHGFRRIPFAGALKDMARAIGLTDREIDGDQKEIPCELLGGKTPRFFMQRLGTEFGREMIDPLLWVRAWRRAVNNVPTGAPIVVDDIRFANEAGAVRGASPNSMIIRIMRTNGNDQSSHVSELQTVRADMTIHNNGSTADLLAKVDALLATPDHVPAV